MTAAARASVASLSFKVTAQVSPAHRADRPRTTTAKVFLRGQAMRVEMQLAAQPTVLLLVPPYGYRLLPQTKTGVRYKAKSLFPELERFSFSWQELLASPQKIRHTVEYQGAKKTGTATVGGTQTDIYTASKWQGRPARIKLWLRKSDALPVRMESVEDGIKAVVVWNNYRRSKIAASLMTVPKNYHIRDGRPPRLVWP